MMNSECIVACFLFGIATMPAFYYVINKLMNDPWRRD